MPASEYFSPDYAAARTRFRDAAARAGADLSAFELPDHKGPNGEALTLDVARIGAASAEAALLILSGTHGVEGFCGSGCQVGFCADRLYDALPPSTCAVLVHALNPFGFAWCRRVTEDGVDLNRNFIDFSHPPSSAAYEALHDALVPQEWQGDARRTADQALDAFANQHGRRALQAAVSGGQYTRPTGLFYGGTRPTWSARTLAEILKNGLPAGLRRLAVLDLHTGLGPIAYGEPILTAMTPAERERARRWYGAEMRDLAADESVSAQLVGTLSNGFAAARPDLELTFLALEFGTRSMPEVLTALRADHWLHAAPGRERHWHSAIQRQMRDAFYVETPAWQAAVYGRTADFIYRACRGLGSS